MQKDSETISLKKIIVDYLYHWKVFLVAACISLVCAILYMVIYPQTYEFVARIKIQEDKNLGSGGSMGLGEAAGLMKSFGLGSISGGAVRRYFVCPACHKTVRYLYIVGKRLVCRRCAGANYAIQQMSRDDLAVERAKKIFAKLQVDISDMCPMDFMQYRSEIKRPKGMNPEEYCKLIRKRNWRTSSTRSAGST